MKYHIKSALKQEVLDLLIERRATTLPRIKSIVLKDKEMYLAKWLKYFSLEELDYYLEPVTEYDEVIMEPIDKKVSESYEEEINNNVIDEQIRKEEAEYYGI